MEKYSTYQNAQKILIGNKIDLEDERKVSKKMGENFAKENGMLFLECSSKTKIGVII
jgi:Ras-related protein Rab-18